MISHYLPFLIIFVVLLAFREFFTFRKKLSLKYIFTPLITLTIIITALCSLKIFNISTYSIFTVTGLILALVGDTLLMIEETDLFLYGLLFFFLTQLSYITAFSTNYSFAIWNIIPAAGLLAFICFFYMSIKKRSKKWKSGILAYMLAIAVMLYFAIAGFNEISGKNILILTGAILFVISDVLIAINKFIKKIPNSTIIVWAIYAPSQLLIGLSNYYT
ncbi:MAG: lysoplasmalogenase [Spirochaetes bacterium]|nr:lysoplasmalogenase [Spirochaetota bacterium]